ncbi:hypothetical protein, partial [Streptomyces kunmingensis]|uniref:hypothetical protein n=1 Tax=Streptomyces kunmingensis TaxID=68225 RepID=UPI002D789D0A
RRALLEGNADAEGAALARHTACEADRAPRHAVADAAPADADAHARAVPDDRGAVVVRARAAGRRAPVDGGAGTAGRESGLTLWRV